MRILLIVCFILLSSLCGCLSSPPDEQFVEKSDIMQEKQSKYGYVALNDIETPAFEQEFASVKCDSEFYNVAWAIGDKSVMWKDSGYPGFGYPIVIETENSITTTSCIVSTQWGTYEYSFVSTGYAFKEDNNLINKENGEVLIKWGEKEEILVLWNNKTQEYTILEFVDGTKIVLEE